tara:strand:- start:978 stop:1082 length:105 start_codon:yes stop_codon:yes gene_type:complete
LVKEKVMAISRVNISQQIKKPKIKKVKKRKIKKK